MHRHAINTKAVERSTYDSTYHWPATEVLLFLIEKGFYSGGGHLTFDFSLPPA